MPTWLAVARKLHRLQHEQHRRGGIRPGDLKHKLRTDRHLKTTERHLRLLEHAGFVERNSVKGCPRRGPGTRVRYFLLHALGLKPAAALAEAEPRKAPAPPPAATQEPARPPPDPGGPASARETLEHVRARQTTR